MSFACPAVPVLPWIVYLGTANASGAATSRSFADFPLGTPANDRLIVVVAGMRDAAGFGRLFSGQSIGGVSSTEHMDLNTSEIGFCIFSAPVPTGATGTIAYTLSSTTDFDVISVYAVYGLAMLTATAAASNSGTPSSVSLNVLSNGVIIGGAVRNSATTFTTSCLTENFDGQHGSATFVAASAQDVIGSSARAISFSAGGAVIGGAVSFR